MIGDLCERQPREEKSSVEGGTVSEKALRKQSPLCVQGQSDWSGISKEENVGYEGGGKSESFLTAHRSHLVL